MSVQRKRKLFKAIYLDSEGNEIPEPIVTFEQKKAILEILLRWEKRLNERK